MTPRSIRFAYRRPSGLPGPMVGVLLVLLLVGLSAMPARAEISSTEPVVASATKVGRSFFVADQLDRTKQSPQAVENAAFTNVLLFYHKNPEFLPSNKTAPQVVTEWRNEYQKRNAASAPYADWRSEGEIINSVLEVGNTLPGVGTVTKAMQELGKHFNVYGTFSAIDRMGLAEDLAQLHERYSPLAVSTYEQAYDLAQKDAAFARDWNRSVGATTGSDIRLGPVDRMTRNPALRTLKNVIDLVDATGRLQTDVGSIRHRLDMEFASVHREFAETTAWLARLDAGQTELLTYARAGEARRLAEEAARKDADERQLRLDAAQASVYILSSFLGLKDPRAGHDAAVVGGAAIQIVNACNSWGRAISSVGEGALAFDGFLSTVVFGGNVLTAVTQIAGLLNPQATPDQQILTEVRALRQDLAALHTDMGNRFDRVDRSLDQLWGQMLREFEQIALLRGNALESQRRFLDLQSQMQTFEGHVFMLAQDASLRPLVEAIDAGLGYRERTGMAMSFADFTKYESLFYVWATQHSRDQVANAPPGRVYDGKEIDAWLHTYPLEANLGYLSAFGDVRWSRRLLRGAAVNPRVWALAARAYASLMGDWPEFGAEIDARRIKAIRDIGEDLRQDLETVVGAPSETVEPLSGLALSDYRTALKRLLGQDGALERYFKARASERMPNPFDESPRIDEGQLHAKFPDLVPECGGNGPSVSWPPEEVSTTPKDYQVAVMARPGEGDVCWTADWICEKGGGRPNAQGVCPVGALVLRTEVSYKFEGKVFVTRRNQWQWPPLFFIKNPVATSWAAKIWETSTPTLKSRLLGAAPEVTAGDKVLLGERLASVMKADRAGVYLSVGRSISAGAIDGSELRDAVSGVAGERGAIESLFELGAPRSLQSDDLFASLVRGREGLVGGPATELYGLIAQAFESAAATDRNPIPALLLKSEDRVSALELKVAGYRTAASEGAPRDSLPIVTTTLQRLDLAGALTARGDNRESSGSRCGGGATIMVPLALGLIAIAERRSRRRRKTRSMP